MSRKQALIRGTAVLTVTSLSTRFMGFFYRMFLSHTFGEENVGLYQLVFPVYALGISLSCAGMELALSRCVAREAAAGRMQKTRELLKTSLIFTFFISCMTSRFQMQQSFVLIILHISICIHSQLHLWILAGAEADKDSGCIPASGASIPHFVRHCHLYVLFRTGAEHLDRIRCSRPHIRRDCRFFLQPALHPAVLEAEVFSFPLLHSAGIYRDFWNTLFHLPQAAYS